MIINIGVSIISILVIICLIVRVLSLSGISTPCCNGEGKVTDFRNRLFASKVDSLYVDTKCTVNRKDILMVALSAAVFRIVVYIISAVMMRLYLDADTVVDGVQFITEWKKWDANNYIRIATLGYGGYSENGMFTTLVFFPLYSWLIKLVELIITDAEVSALLVSSVCYTIGCCYLYAVIASEYGKSIAKKTVIYISIFPFSFFFGSMMPESVFFMLICMVFYYVKEENWSCNNKKSLRKFNVGYIATAIIGIFAALSRMQGVLLIIPVVIEWLDKRKPFVLIKEKKSKTLWGYIFKELIWVPFMVVGSLIYLLINYLVTGDAFKFLEYQKAIWAQEAQWFGKTVADLFDRAFTNENIGFIRVTVWLPEFVLFVFFLGLIIYGIGKVHDKYIVFLMAYLIMNYLPAWLLSAGRYMTVAVPAFLILAVYSEKHKWADKWITCVSCILFGMYLYGFLTWKQIM